MAIFTYKLLCLTNANSFKAESHDLTDDGWQPLGSLLSFTCSDGRGRFIQPMVST